jgi:hypothetical protein
MECALTICIKAGIGGDLHHLSDMLDTCELRSLIKHIFQVIVKETAHTERLVVSLISSSVCGLFYVSCLLNFPTYNCRTCHQGNEQATKDD